MTTETPTPRSLEEIQRQTVGAIQKSTSIISLLYDLDLLAEQLEVKSLDWRRMVILVEWLALKETELTQAKADRDAALARVAQLEGALERVEELVLNIEKYPASPQKRLATTLEVLNNALSTPTQPSTNRGVVSEAYGLEDGGEPAPAVPQDVVASTFLAGWNAGCDMYSDPLAPQTYEKALAAYEALKQPKP